MKEKVVFSYDLTENQASEYYTFFNSYNNATHFQHHQWLKVSQPKRQVRAFMLYIDNELSAVACIVENKVVANVMFGPLANSNENYVRSIEVIKNFYRSKRKFAELRITQPNTVSESTEALEYQVFKRFRFRQKLDKNNLFAIAINLNLPTDQLMSQFVRNNKRGVNKAIKLGFQVREIQSPSEIKRFAEIYDAMVNARGIDNPFKSTGESFLEIHSFLQASNIGKMLGIFNGEGLMMGGIVVMFRNDYAHYELGGSDPEFRKLPIMHYLFYEAMVMSKNLGHKWFDLGGYNLMTTEKDQATHINKFKEGFGGVPRIYPKKMYFSLNPFVYAVFKLAMKFKR